MKLMKFINKCRRLDLTMNLLRRYIVKPNGKLRPIGEPSFDSRAISKSINNLNYLILFRGKEINHAYVYDKGCHSAVLEICENINNGLVKVYSFDLKSFFNTIS